jgi:hypothetical protein
MFHIENESYKNWASFYEKDLRNMYNIFKFHTKRLNTSYKPFNFNEFCNFIYKKSSKRKL